MAVNIRNIADIIAQNVQNIAAGPVNDEERRIAEEMTIQLRAHEVGNVETYEQLEFAEGVYS